MARKTKDQTRRKLRDAVVAEAVEKGFSAASVAGVVARAHVSAGTVYVHFKNKDDMLQQVFLEIKSEFHAIMVAAKAEPDSAAMIRRMWFDMFDFVAAHPAEFLFLDTGSSARFLAPTQEAQVHQFSLEINDMLRSGVADGTLADLDAGTLSLLLVAPAMQMARGAVLSGKALPTDHLDVVFARVWRSIAADC